MQQELTHQSPSSPLTEADASVGELQVGAGRAVNEANGKKKKPAVKNSSEHCLTRRKMRVWGRLKEALLKYKSFFFLCVKAVHFIPQT